MAVDEKSHGIDNTQAQSAYTRLAAHDVKEKYITLK